ncbi:flagellar basal body-associated FliL family protein [Pseudoxanthomonas beigongshangi]
MPRVPPAEKPDPKLLKPAPKAGKPWLIIGLVAIIAAGAAGGGAWFFASRNATPAKPAAKAAPEASKVPAPAQYFALEPPFVVNLIGSAGGARYLQVEVQLMTRDPESLKAIELHAPALRAKLLMLFAQQNAEELITRAGKEKLQAQALAEVRKLMKAETGKPGAEQLLFTSFVMQ